MTPSKKSLRAAKIIFAIFSKPVALFEKIVRWKNIQNLISYKKKGYIHSFSSPNSPFPSKET